MNQDMREAIDRANKMANSWNGKGLLFRMVVMIIVISGILFAGFRSFFVDFIDNYEVAYKYDVRTGKVEILNEKGWIVTWPILVKVHTVDLRPMQVCINANARVLNCKLVQFDPQGIELFLSWHGRADYEGGDHGNLGDILKSYAYDGSGKNYPFLTVLRELKPDEAVVR